LQAQQPGLKARQSAAAAAEAAAVQALLAAAPACPLPSRGCNCVDFQLAETINAVYHGINSSAYVKVPQFSCGCGKSLAYPHFFAAGCIATTPQRPSTLISLTVVQQFQYLSLHAGLSAESECTHVAALLYIVLRVEG
jgi:hypothetical protein